MHVFCTYVIDDDDYNPIANASVVVTWIKTNHMDENHAMSCYLFSVHWRCWSQAFWVIQANIMFIVFRLHLSLDIVHHPGRRRVFFAYRGDCDFGHTTCCSRLLFSLLVLLFRLSRCIVECTGRAANLGHPLRPRPFDRLPRIPVAGAVVTMNTSRNKHPEQQTKESVTKLYKTGTPLSLPPPPWHPSSSVLKKI